ncbi:ferredoxin [Nocardia niigatensis]|uniref:Ferredoxin n=1 Tax=Nocardia cerradoensis TaxID=85688 RepID=A0A231GVH2_9NOCA|nr:MULTISPECIES: ferredoxin [Nocardia]OXR40630.1 hypothetical protein B7C42_07315 [Nocardia cerradoensis]
MTIHTASEPCGSAGSRPPRPYDEADLSSTAFWASSASERESTFAEPEPPECHRALIEEAVSACPTGALSVEE